MKLYGIKRIEIRTDDYIIGYYKSGRQSRKFAHRRAKDKKIFHRRGRRTQKFKLGVGNDE